MKMTTRLMAIVLALLTASTVMAQADPSDEIKSAVRSMFREIAQGDFEAALGERIMIGASGFLREGLLREAPDAETLAMVVAQYRAAYEEGTRIQVLPSHINVMGNDRGALATFLLEGSITEDGETTSVLDRVSQLWLKVDGDWKLAHFHYSRLTLPEIEEEEEEEYEHEDHDHHEHEHEDHDDDEHEDHDHDDEDH